MKISRTKNAKSSILYGGIYKIYQIVVPFVMRTIMIYQMGLQYAGLNNLFVSIFQVLNLAELGVGAALTCSMYKPIAEDNRDEICALLKLYKKCFILIGLIILLIGCFCVPFLDKLVYGEVPQDLDISILYLLYLLNTVLSYWLLSYKSSLLYAHQRNDVISKVLLLTSTIQFGIQAFVLIFLKNYYLYLIAAIMPQVLLNLICAFISDKMYPEYRPKGELEKEVIDDIIKKIKGLLTNKIGGTILRSADSIVISSFLGLSILAVYQNYYFILTGIIGLLGVVFQSLCAGIGNSLVVESEEKNYKDFKIVTNIVGWLVCICCSCFTTLYQPFISLWVGDDCLLDFGIVVCLIVYFFLFEIDQMIGVYKDAAGIWYSDRFRPLISAIFNLFLNIILVNICGLYGVLISTIIALALIDIPWLIHNVFHSIFNGKSVSGYVFILLKLGCYSFVSSAISNYLCGYFSSNSFFMIIVRLFFAILVPLSIIILFEHKSDSFFKLRVLFLKNVK